MKRELNSEGSPYTDDEDFQPTKLPKFDVKSGCENEGNDNNTTPASDKNTKKTSDEQICRESRETSTSSQESLADGDTNRLNNINNNEQCRSSQQRASQNSQSEQSQNDNRPKRNPFCSRCRNHGKCARVKGHKRHCEYRECQCDGCKLVESRQIISAAQIKRRREQKQDEECGRQIEVSPPVLKRKPSNDPASLIADILIGSGRRTSSIVTPGSSSETALDPSTMAPKNISGQHHQHLSSLHQSASDLAPMSVVPIASTSMNNPHSHSSNQHHGFLTPHHPVGLDLQQHQSQTAGSVTPPRVSSTQSVPSALHLLHFTNPVLSVASLGPGAVGSSSLITTSAGIDSTSGSSSAQNNATSLQLPSIQDQIFLIDDIYQTYGPLAIYAWLRNEQFDLQKIRKMIEISRAPYSSLVELKSSNNPNQELVDTKKSTNNTDNQRDKESVRTNSSYMKNQQQSQHRDLANQAYTTTPNSTMAHCINNSTLGSSPPYALATGASIGNYSAKGFMNGQHNPMVASPAAKIDLQRSIEALTSSHLNNPFLDASSAHDSIWSSLNGVSHAVLHPNHLIPHYIHHHRTLLAQHARHQEQLNQQISPASNFTSSNSSSSSSSAVF